jgi:hypothetical protein
MSPTGEVVMDPEMSADGADLGKDAARKEVWHTPRLAAIEAHGAELGAGMSADGPYPDS